MMNSSSFSPPPPSSILITIPPVASFHSFVPFRWFRATATGTSTTSSDFSSSFFDVRSLSSSSTSLTLVSPGRRLCRSGVTLPYCNHREDVISTEKEDEYQVVTAVRSNHNDIVILDTPQSRMLLLDSTHSVHSIYKKGEIWTGSYWDEFASLPAIVPKGPIAIFGLGGGTAAHLMLDLWPSLELEGWDIDEVLIDKAREYFGLSNIERRTPAGGILHVRIGDALSPSVYTPGGYAGIAIDLFADGKVIPQLTQVATWLKLNDKLMPNGRLMVNCGGADNGVSNKMSPDTAWENNSSIRAMHQAFFGQFALMIISPI